MVGSGTNGGPSERTQRGMQQVLPGPGLQCIATTFRIMPNVLVSSSRCGSNGILLACLGKGNAYGVMTIVFAGSLQTSRFPLDRGLHEVQNGLEREKQNSLLWSAHSHYRATTKAAPLPLQDEIGWMSSFAADLQIPGLVRRDASCSAASHCKSAITHILVFGLS